MAEPNLVNQTQVESWISTVVTGLVSSKGLMGSTSQSENDPFYITPAEMSSIGLNAFMLGMQPFLSRDSMSLKLVKPSAFDSFLNTPIPTDGSADFTSLMKEVQPLFDSIQREDHPGFVGYTQSYPNYVSCMGELLRCCFNPIIPVEWTAPGFNALQRLVVKWLCGIVGYNSPEMGGHCVSGGSEANELCLAAALAKFEAAYPDEHRLDLRKKAVVYVSGKSHQCMAAAAHTLGLDVRHQVIFLENLGVKDHFKIDPVSLIQQIKGDVSIGKIPIFLSACGGSTMLAAYDDYVELAGICKEFNIWFHIDGAWGGASLVIPQGKALFKGAELSDSFVIDPHKGLYEPYGLGVALMKNANYLRMFFSGNSFHHPDLDHCEKANSGDRFPHNMKDFGRQLTQPCKVFGFYLALKYFGLSTYQRAVQLSWDQSVYLAKLAHARSCWRVLIEPRFAMVTIQYVASELSHSANNELNSDIVKLVSDKGVVYPNTNIFRGVDNTEYIAIRLVLMNPMATGYCEKLLFYLESAACELLSCKQSKV